MTRVGLIGYGAWGPNLARNLAACGARLVTICDLRPDRLREATARYPDAKATAQWGEVVTDAAVDAVAVATPPSSHFLIAEACLAAGKHVLVEKPLTTSRRDAGRLMELADRRRLTLMVDHTFLYVPAVLQIGRLIRQGRLGEVRSFESIRTGPPAPDADAGALWDLAPHDVAILDHLFGMSPIGVSARAVQSSAKEPVEEALLDFDYASGLTARIHVGWRSPVKVRIIRIAGTRGTLVYDDTRTHRKLQIDDVEYVEDGPTAEVEPLAAMVGDFLQSVATGRRPMSDSALALRVVGIVEDASVSLAAGGRAVTPADAVAGAMPR